MRIAAADRGERERLLRYRARPPLALDRLRELDPEHLRPRQVRRVDGALRAKLLGSFKFRAAAAGPEVGYVFKVGDKRAYANLRAYWEIWAEHRVEGYAIATVSLPLRGQK